MTRNDAPSVPQQHVSVIDESLEHRRHLSRGLVELVDDKDAAMSSCAHERAVFPPHDAAPQRWCKRQRRHSRVAVQLHVLPFPTQRLEEVINHTILAGSLVSKKKQVPRP